MLLVLAETGSASRCSASAILSISSRISTNSIVCIFFTVLLGIGGKLLARENGDSFSATTWVAMMPLDTIGVVAVTFGSCSVVPVAAVAGRSGSKLSDAGICPA